MEYLIKNINDIFYNEQILLTIRKDKRNHINNIKNINAQKRAITGELLLIKGLKDFYKINYKNIIIKTNMYGKPYISNKKYQNIYFNISHSHDFAICAFSNKKIGVDIEKIREVNIQIINTIATNKEKEYILSNKKLIYERLFTIFTLKEAYFKKIGSNLNNLKSVEFNINNNSITCSDSSVEIIINTEIEGYIIAFCQDI